MRPEHTLEAPECHLAPRRLLAYNTGMEPTDAIQINQFPHGTELRKGDVSTFLDATQRGPAARAYAHAIALARTVYGPRWRSVAGPNLSQSEYEALLDHIVFEWLYFYAINKKPLVVTLDDLAHPYAWRRVRAAASKALGGRTAEANRLAAQLLDLDQERYEWWLEYEDKMDEVR